MKIKWKSNTKKPQLPVPVMIQALARIQAGEPVAVVMAETCAAAGIEPAKTTGPWVSGLLRGVGKAATADPAVVEQVRAAGLQFQE